MINHDRGRAAESALEHLGGTGKGRRIGLFGGTFDPPHVGHLVTAVNVRHALDLDVVILMVANIPWQKEGTRAITPATDRLAMVEAAVEGVPGMVAGRWEIDHGGQSYTAETLEGLVQQWPDAEFFTIVGDDAAGGLQTWERLEIVCSLSRIVVVDRPGHDPSLDSGPPLDSDPSLDSDNESVFVHVEVPRLEVSSTDLRARFADGRPLDYLITEPVLDVIRERSLYSESVGSTR